jgi:hypothetical protein
MAKDLRRRKKKHVKREKRQKVMEATRVRVTCGSDLCVRVCVCVFASKPRLCTAMVVLLSTIGRARP